MRLSIEERNVNLNIYLSGTRLMFVALDDKKVIGIIETYGNNRISLSLLLNQVDLLSVIEYLELLMWIQYTS